MKQVTESSAVRRRCGDYARHPPAGGPKSGSIRVTRHGRGWTPSLATRRSFRAVRLTHARLPLRNYRCETDDAASRNRKNVWRYTEYGVL
ncbi:hypothetical protein EVAR_92602_1 [Eumeta japonica]|uniref:Uncharacterized protein n=1 Tax=Eumeta variegata TaxID=151549 RepID=A0A4C1SXH2_EUMVA|nr:hypothetical protein EVAR_92602_1 [Eumeta japonica]